ncbi:MAG TPA: 5'-3' exonuclease H3TH domain-containing protein [Planctomycetota bacterium]|nr:5'-3' exonuclease H3TH domain-containing protein [Planctomycetota bacterium]
MDSPRQSVLAWVRRYRDDYDRVIVCRDSPGSWRREIFPGYKASREHTAQEREQLRKLEEELAREFPVLGADGFEADDICATVAEALRGPHDVTVVSADKDLLACIGDNCDVLRPHTEPPTLVTYDDLLDQGLNPLQVPHWLALMGDKADEIPGVNLVGDKRAKALLAAFESVSGVVAAALDSEVKMTPKVRAAILEADQRADCPLVMALRLTTLRTDAPVDAEAALEWRPKQTPMTAEDEMPEYDCVDDCPDPEPTQPSEREPVVIEAEPVSEKPAPSVAMTLAPVEWERGLEPRSMDEAKALARYVLDSRMFSAYGTAQAALLVIMAGRELGIGAMASLRSFHVVEGKPSPSAQLLMGLCLRSPAVKTFRIVEDGRDKAVVETQRHDWSEPKLWEFTIEDAQDAGLTGKGNWKKYRRDMLLNRCIARAARFTAPEAVANLYDPEELEQA